MENMNFGNLMDWGNVLEILEDFKKNDNLDAHQGELIRLFRFDQNWRLREAAIEALESVRKPGVELAKEVYALVGRKDLYYDVRILAVNGLSKLMEKIVGRSDLDVDEVNGFMEQAVKGLEEYLETPEPPKFHDALDIALNRMRHGG